MIRIWNFVSHTFLNLEVNTIIKIATTGNKSHKTQGASKNALYCIIINKMQIWSTFVAICCLSNSVM